MKEIRADIKADISDSPSHTTRDSDPDIRPRNRRVFRVEDLPDETIEAIKNAKMDPRHDHLNDLLKDWKP
jgi:hypothetical protein